MSTLKVNAIQNTSGVEQFLAKAWVNFNGEGTVAIRASGNVSSITDNGTGKYTINFTTAFADANYAVSGMTECQSGTDGDGNGVVTFDRDPATFNTTSSVRVYSCTVSGPTPTDASHVTVSIVR